jgi:cytochrome c
MQLKNKLIFFPILFFLAACGGGSSSKTADSGNSSGNDVTKSAAYQDGLALVSKDNCLTCHKIDEKLTGPAYRDVANKYAGLPDTIVAHLAKKIISGGTGVWGQVLMTPHAALSEEDAEKMVKYILLLKK